ncbi:uncharacterized protein ARMOST_15051 [Armillaria ostoyae]|uniref:XPG-I domain-containing protein n=1 Tax=Armillaria ostoyae TaxID=47428 RepID=A0A284RSG3_ARMOS|nr:uncharacterized protein ARMOST_15051 [Armillaria ostoyae]
MGVKGGWDLLNPTSTVSFVDWASEKISTGAGHELVPRIGVDASGWMSAATFHHGQTKSPAQASLFKRLGCLFHLPVIPLFVFDGPHRPTYKRKKTVKKTPVWLTNDFKRLLEGFGFSYWEAPGEAEAELAMLSRLDRIDAVMSEDFDAMLFGAQRVFRIKEESDSKYLIEVYEAGSQFSCNNLVMIALLAGGDYDDGIQGCGIQTAAGIAKSSIGKQLFDALEAFEVDGYAAVASAWRQDLSMTLETQGSRQRSLASRIPLDFPKVSVLIQYLHPVTSQSNGPNNVPAAPSLSQPNISHLAKLCEELFVWGHSMGIIRNFRDHVFPGLATRDLLQDLCKRRGLFKDDDAHISQHAIVSKARAVRANQLERSRSEIYVSFVLPGEILTQITSAIDGTYNTDTTTAEYDQFVKKPEVRAWLSRILTLHARPNTLDDIQHPTLKTGEKRKMVKPSIEKTRLIEAEPSVSQPVASTSANLRNQNRSYSVLEISSDESGDEMTEAAPIKRQKRASSPKYRIEVRYTVKGEILELCTDDENGF